MPNRKKKVGEKLSVCERRVMERLVAGDETRDIALANGVTYHTVRNQLKSIYQKLGVHTKLGAIAKFGGASPVFRQAACAQALAAEVLRQQKLQSENAILLDWSTHATWHLNMAKSTEGAERQSHIVSSAAALINWHDKETSAPEGM